MTKRSSPIQRLNPILDKDGILRVGGRLSQTSAPHRPNSSPFSPKKRPPGSSENARRNPFVRLLDNGR